MGESKTKKAGKSTKKMTVKQATSKANNIIKGIDNHVKHINKHVSALEADRKTLGTLLAGLSNDALSAQSEAAAAKKEAASVKKEATKPQKTKKDRPKANKRTSGVKATKAKSKKSSAKAKSPVKDRPTIKEAITEIIKESGPDEKPNLYKKVVAKYGSWSRQSFYKALKDEKSFKIIGDNIDIVSNQNGVSNSSKDEQIQKFVSSVNEDQAVAKTI